MNATLPAQQWDTDEVLTVPNAFSFVRLLGIPAFCWLILVGQDLAALALLVAFGATDWVDGFLARKLRQRTALGAKLDPIADRLYILTTVVALLLRRIVPPWFVVVLFARDLMLLALVPILRRHGMVALPVNRVGKAATLMLLIAMPMLLMGAASGLGWAWAHWAGWALGAGGAVLYWAAGVLYVRDVVRLERAR